MNGVGFRGLEEKDIPFIISTWCGSERDLIRLMHGIDRKAVADSSKALCTLAIAHCDWVIAFDKTYEDQSVIYGYVSFCPYIEPEFYNIRNQNVSPIYAYTVAPLRRRGIFKEMKEEYARQCRERCDKRIVDDR